MARKVAAILLDTRSIQKYVFAGDELKTNVGASFIVDQIFEGLMCNKILPELQKNGELANVELDWKNNTAVKMASDKTISCEIAYIGGGNMLIVVDTVPGEPEKSLPICKKIVAAWSKELLFYAPGLRTGAAIGILDLDAKSYKELIDELYASLKNNQSMIIPEVDLPYTGFTKECDVSGKTAVAYDYSKGNRRMVSAEVLAKIKAYCKADDALCKKYKDVLNGYYTFADEFEKIGYKDGESYLCVIHIDGNNMGKRFSECNTLQERKLLSIKVQETVEKSFNSLLKSIVYEYQEYKDYLAMDKLSSGEKVFLPIRPIIIGGDDVTFVCPGRLGLEYATRFIKAIEDEGIITCCAGVAIVPARYPFFRAYTLANQLCDEAKKKSRANNDSWLDFLILHGEMTPELEQLRKRQYVGAEGKLHFGPYKVVGEGMESLASLYRLEARLNDAKPEGELMDRALKAKAARSKIKKLRDVLTKDYHAMERFLELAPEIVKIIKEEKQRLGIKLGESVTAKDLWEKQSGEFVTRFVDAIEIMDFRPEAKEK